MVQKDGFRRSFTFVRSYLGPKNKPIREEVDVPPPDLSNHPFFVKKAEEVEAWMKSTGVVFDKEY